MREELIDLLHFLKSVYISDSRTINTCSLINDEILKGYADTIEKILSGDVILVDKNKLEHKFEEAPYDIKNEYVILQKNFALYSKVRIPRYEYQPNRLKTDFQEYINKMLTMKLLDYFIEEVGIKGDD